MKQIMQLLLAVPLVLWGRVEDPFVAWPTEEEAEGCEAPSAERSAVCTGYLRN